MKVWMHRILGLTALILLTLSWHTGMAQETSQQKYYIYIQNESGSPFYVKKNNDVLSSTQAGYIIIPQLKEGKYQLTIGLPGNQVPEASFDIEVSGKGDKGFLLKSADKKLNLYALKDFSVVKPVAIASAAGNRIVDIPKTEDNKKAAPAQDTNQVDDLLATSVGQNDQQAVEEGDSAKKQTDTSDFAKMLNEITGKNAPAPVVAQATPQKQQQDKAQPEDATPPKEKEVKTAEPDTPDSSVRIQPEDKFDQLAGDISLDSGRSSASKAVPESKPSSGNDLSFINFPDQGKNQNIQAPVAVSPATDAVSAEDSLARQEAQRRMEKEQRRQERKAKREAKKADSHDLDTNTVDFASMEPVATTKNNEQQDETPETPSAEKEVKKAAGIPNSDCRNLADEDQFQKVRRKMASRTDDEGIFRIAEKFLKDNVCYSSEQIQSLTYLFVSDEYKYKFLELAYPHVYDSVHFGGLVKTLSSTYYKGRFNALVGR